MSALDVRRLDAAQLVPPTPFSADGSAVIPSRLADLCRDLFEAGIRVFLPAAGTGEFHSLSEDEVLDCVKATREALGSEAVVIAPVGFGVGHASWIAERAEDAGADALLLMPPVHPYLCDSGFADYFRAIASATKLPFLAYKKGPIPSDRLLGELASEGRLIGVKYAVNDLDAFSKFADAHRGKLGLYCGTAERFAPFFMLAGASGYTTGAGNICPRLTLSIHKNLASSRYDDAVKILRVLRPIEDYRARDADSYNIAVIKQSLRVLGRDFGPTRPPQRRLSPSEIEEISKMLQPILAAESALSAQARTN